MTNSQLLTLLARTPISDEDRYNVTVIFHALSESRQEHILDHWEFYASRLVAERENLDNEQERMLLDALRQANTLLDEAIIRNEEKESLRKNQTRQVREELEATAAYNQMKQMKKIREIAKSR